LSDILGKNICYVKDKKIIELASKIIYIDYDKFMIAIINSNTIRPYLRIFSHTFDNILDEQIIAKITFKKVFNIFGRHAVYYKLLNKYDDCGIDTTNFDMRIKK
jgi:hypothetical protein